MQDDIREQIALFRYRLISPILVEPAREQNAYFRQQATQTHGLPHYGPRQIAPSTMKAWLRAYRLGGFDALRPKPRADMGRPRRLGDQELAAIRAKARAYPFVTVRRLHEMLIEHGQLGDPPACYNTLVRIVKQEKLRPDGARSDERKRFETPAVNELWVCDFMHGPTVRLDEREKARRAKAILCAIIDDHSRMIVGYAFSAHETVSVLTLVLKEALLAFGLPKRLYVDNGPAFSSDLLATACARMGVSLVHSKPYDSPSRGKIERFFRTVRDRFLSGLTGELTLDELNDAFAAWLTDDYHHKAHGGIDARPVDRYHASAGRLDIRRLSAHELDEFLLVRYERVVGNDATISFKGRVFEVPAAYIRQRIEIRHPVDDADQLWLYDSGARVGRLRLVDVNENARTFRPSGARDAISFARGEVKK